MSIPQAIKNSTVAAHESNTASAQGNTNLSIAESSKQQTDLLFGLIHVGPKLLWQFIESTREDVQMIRTLSNSAPFAQDAGELLGSILRLLHSMKGNAALLDLTVYTEYVHRLEDEALGLKARAEHLCEEDFTIITDNTLALEQELAHTAELLQDLVQVQSSMTKESSITQAFITSLEQLVEELSLIYNSKIRLQYTQLNLDNLPEPYSELAVDVLLQLVRNAVVYGIESRPERQRLGKPYSGSLYLCSDRLADGYRLTVQDDGRGLDLERVKKIALKSGLLDVDDANPISDAELAAMIFQPGFSTAENSTTAAGRGVGMDLVQQRVEQYNGEIQLTFTQGQGCRFDMLLPDLRMVG